MADKKVVLTTRPLHQDVAEKLGRSYEVRVAESLDSETLAAQARVADALIVRDPIEATVLADPGRLRVAVRHGAGLDMIPVEAATAAGVLVSSAPGANAPAVAEHVALATLGLLRRQSQVRVTLESEGWLEARKMAADAQELGTSTVGIVGLGNVGSRVSAIIRRGFGATVLGFDAYAPKPFENAESTELDDLFTRSDIVVLCCPLTPETRHLVSRERLAHMKQTAFLVNAARGGVVDNEALIAAIESGVIAGAALDVFEEEPLPANDPLWQVEEITITPHVAAVTEPSDIRVGLHVLSEIDAVFAGGLPRNLANPAALQRFDQRFGTDHHADGTGAGR
jgi:D-3-phosphoglycerate dehydrogenase